jgi:hypothetical protein
MLKTERKTMEPIGDNYTAYTLKDLQHLAREAERLNKGNGLELYLKQNGFRQESDRLFSLASPEQIIELTPGENGMTYLNRLDKNDEANLSNSYKTAFWSWAKSSRTIRCIPF